MIFLTSFSVRRYSRTQTRNIGSKSLSSSIFLRHLFFSTWMVYSYICIVGYTFYAFMEGKKEGRPKRHKEKHVYVYFVEWWFITNIFQFLKYIFWLTRLRVCVWRTMCRIITWGYGNMLVEGHNTSSKKCRFFFSCTSLPLVYSINNTHTERKIWPDTTNQLNCLF